MSSVVHSAASSKCAARSPRTAAPFRETRQYYLHQTLQFLKVTRLLMQLGDISPAPQRLALQFLVAPTDLLATGGSEVLSTIRE